MKSRGDMRLFYSFMHYLLKMTCFANIWLQRMFCNTLKAELNLKSAMNEFLYDKVLLLSSLESTFVAIHGRRRLLWCVLFKCLRCTSNLYLFSTSRPVHHWLHTPLWIIPPLMTSPRDSSWRLSWRRCPVLQTHRPTDTPTDTPTHRPTHVTVLL